jgi:hypothetical protein
MTGIANTIECRLMCASSCAYSIDENGDYTAESPYTEAVGWLDTHPPVAVVWGGGKIKNFIGCVYKGVWFLVGFFG